MIQDVPAAPPMQRRATLVEAQRAFLDSLVGKSPRTVATYASSLRRWNEHLRERKLKPEEVSTDDLDLIPLQPG